MSKARLEYSHKSIKHPMAGMHRLAPPLSLNQEQEQEYRLRGNQIRHDFKHPVAKYNKAKENVRERAVFWLGRETLFCPVPQASP